MESAVAPEGFSGRFASGSDEVTEGFVHWQLIFVLCFGMLSGTRTCCLRIHFCDGMGLLKFGCKKWPNMEGKGMSGTESRRM